MTRLKISANDNHKWEHFDDAVRLAIELGMMDIVHVFRSVVDDNRNRSAHNFYWYLRFEKSYRNMEVREKRSTMRIVE